MTDTKKTTVPRRFARTPQVERAGVSSEQETPPASMTAPPAAVAAAKPDSKIAQVIALLTRPEGATLQEMTGATGWLPHTTRAALTGLKKKGHTIVRSKRGDGTCYRITPEA